MSEAREHKFISHPFRDLKQGTSRFNDRFIDFMTDKVLASTSAFYLSLVVPLITIPMSDTIKLIVTIIASSWFQCWALPALQKTQIKADQKRNLKADADHEALTHLALKLDRLEAILLHPSNQKAADD